jgi:60 kDa SS-A/Ro ribonucleoprotein
MLAPSQNREGYPAWEDSLEQQFLQTLLTNTFGKTFYVSQKEVVKEASALHDKMAQDDPEFMAKAIVYARNKGYMRSQPIYGLAKLVSYKGESSEVERRRQLAVDIFGDVIQTPNDLYDFITLSASLGCQLSGRRIKTLINNWLSSRMTEYWAIKYGSAGHQGMSLRKVLRHFHPKHTELFRYLRAKRGGFETNLDKLPQIRAFEALKVAQTEDEKVNAISEGRLPHEVATSFAGSSKAVWGAIVPQLPIFALVRNLATLERHDILDNHRALIESKLTNPEIIAKSKMLPFRFLTAAEKVSSSWATDALREALELSFVNVPTIEGRTAVFLDISVSMQNDFLKVASLFAISILKQTNLNGRLITFNTRAKDIKVSARDSILTQASRIQSDGGTDVSAPMKLLHAQNDKVDTIVLISDEQQNTGTPFYDELLRYRKAVNPKVKTFLINISPYRNAIVNPKDPQVFYIFGWSDQVLNFLSLASQGWKSMSDAIRNGMI